MHTNTLLDFPDYPAKISEIMQVKQQHRAETDAADLGLALSSSPSSLQGRQLACSICWPDRIRTELGKLKELSSRSATATLDVTLIISLVLGHGSEIHFPQ